MKYIIITLSGLLLSASLYALALKNEIKAIKADTQNYKDSLSDFNARLNVKYQIKGADELERVNLLLEKFLSE